MVDLCLGTVQFGMKYGINNKLGQPSLENSFEMLDVAIENGIGVIDTASAYGDAERILGKYFKSRGNVKKVKIISKLKPNVLEPNKCSYDVINKELETSFHLLGVDRLNGFLLHTPEYIYRTDVLNALISLKNQKLVENIGVSIYDIEEGWAAIESGMVDYIQVPYSVLDQRAVKTGFAKKVKEAGITLFTRSAFLQGLFLMSPKLIPSYLKEAVPYILIFENLLDKYKVKKIDALIHFVTIESDIDYLVFGVDTKEQLIENINSYHNSTIPSEFVIELKEQIEQIDKSVIFPSLWANGKKVR